MAARDLWLVVDSHGIQVATGITRKHAIARIDSIIKCSTPSPREGSERSTQETNSGRS